MILHCWLKKKKRKKEEEEAYKKLRKDEKSYIPR